VEVTDIWRLLEAAADHLHHKRSVEYHLHFWELDLVNADAETELFGVEITAPKLAKLVEGLYIMDTQTRSTDNIHHTKYWSCNARSQTILKATNEKRSPR